MAHFKHQVYSTKEECQNDFNGFFTLEKEPWRTAVRFLERFKNKTAALFCRFVRSFSHTSRKKKTILLVESEPFGAA